MRLLSLSIGLILFAVSNSSSAQIVQQVNQVRVGGPIMFGGDESELEAQMRIEVDAIQRATGIQDAAVKKLDVAAKSAIKAVTKKQQAQAAKINPINGVAQPAPAPGGLSDEDAEQKNAQNADGMQPAFQIAFSTTDEVKKEEIWQKTLSNVLNDDQMQAYKKLESDRKARQRSRAVQNHVDQMDAYLLLSEKQRDAVMKIVDQKIGDNLAKQQAFNRAGAVGAVIVIAGVAGNQSIKPEDLQEVLSPVQLLELKRQQELMAAGPLAAMQGMQPAKRKAKDELDLFQSSLGFGVVEADGKLIVREVRPDSPAELAGVQVDDVIDSFDENPVDTMVQLKRAISKSNKSWSMQVRRQGKLISVQIP